MSYAPGVSIITPTGDRPVAFALAERWVARQTRPPEQWIVVDDGRVETTPRAGQEYVRRSEPNVAGPSLNRNLIVALRRVRHEFVVVVEDDDWYSPTYLERMVAHLQETPLAGEGRARYYNVRNRGYRQLVNHRHASLCQTGFSSKLVAPIAEDARALLRCSTPFVDLRIWRHFRQRGVGRVFAQENLAVGIKGMPGRGGYGMGHRLRPGDGARHDPGGDVLASWFAAAAGREADQRRPLAGDAGIYCPERLGLRSWRAWAAESADERPWLLIGKGPSAEVLDRRSIDVAAFRTFGLNHVVRDHDVDVAHAIDLDVVDQVSPERWRDGCGVLVMPWHPHVDSRPDPLPLPVHVLDRPILRELAAAGRLMWYHLENSEPYGTRPADEPAIPVRYFSSEAALELLARTGCRRLATTGIDGGRAYAAAWSDLVPLTNGRQSFDEGVRKFHEVAASHRVALERLGVERAA